jgi:hypothetical protein
MTSISTSWLGKYLVPQMEFESEALVLEKLELPVPELELPIPLVPVPK